MSYLDLTSAPIGASAGSPVGYAGWRFCVQVATTLTGAVLGSFVLGTDVLSEVQWTDVTADVEFVDIERGNAAGENPGAGKLSVRLRNITGAYLPRNGLYFGPGTLCRVSIGPGSTLCPWITAVSTSWNETSDGDRKVRWIDIEADEVTSLLGEVNNEAVSPIGAGESVLARFNRVLDSANWQFGSNPSIPSPVSGWAMQPTTLADDAWTELELVAESTGLVLIADKQGRVCLRPRVNAGTAVTLGSDVPIIADSIDTENDARRVLGQVTAGRHNEDEDVYEPALTYYKSGIEGRYQKRSTSFTNLRTRNPGNNEDLALYANDRLDRGAQTYRVGSVGLNTLNGAAVWNFLSTVDIGSPVNVIHADRDTTDLVGMFLDYFVCKYNIHIEPLSSARSVFISGTIETDTTATSQYAYGPLWDTARWDISTWGTTR